jgi:TonB family protein
MAAISNKRALVAVITTVLALSAGNLLAEESAVQHSHVWDSSNDRTPAVTAFPTYPRIARRDRIEGEAVVCFKITVDGRIRGIRVESYSDRIFRRPVLRAIKDSSFEPLRPHEIYSTARTCRTYRFRLEPVEESDAD